jgi:hypothetical protein
MKQVTTPESPGRVPLAAKDKGASGRGKLAACMRDRENHTLGGCPDSDTYAGNGAGFTEYDLEVEAASRFVILYRGTRE